MSAFTSFVSKRYLKSRKGFLRVITRFSFLGILLGVATLIVVMAVMNGFRHELLTRIIGVRGHVVMHAGPHALEDAETLAQSLQSSPDIRYAFPVIERQAVLTHRGMARGIGIQAMHSDGFQKRPLLKDALEIGSFKDFQGKRVIIGKRLAQQIGIRVGESLLLISPQGRSTAFGTIPKQERFTVHGLFELGMHEYDRSLIFMPLDAAQAFFSFKKHQASEIEIFTHSPDHAPSVAHRLQDAYPNYIALDWQHTNSSYFQAVQMERNLMFIILTLLIVIAAFNIISGLVMLVREKTKDIGILRTMGATKNDVLSLFVRNGLRIGMSATLAGTAIGLFMAFNIERIRTLVEYITGQTVFNAEIYYLIRLPARVDIQEVLSIVAMSVSLSFLAALYPAWKASRLHPVDALTQ
jgi:lipoprotein-releasing system permease protein